MTQALCYTLGIIKHEQLLLMVLLLAFLAGCSRNPTQTDPSGSPKNEITRERAIEIGRTHVKFQPKSINAERTTDNGRPVWRVTFRGEPVSQAQPIGDILVVFVDRKTGEVVSVAKS